MMGIFVAWGDRSDSSGYVIEENGCWTWVGAFSGSGRPVAKVQGRYRSPPRILWERMFGPLPDDVNLQPACGHRDCVNPRHKSRTATPRAGFCECGCGGITHPAPVTCTRKGWKKGMPIRFIKGHNARTQMRRVEPKRDPAPQLAATTETGEEQAIDAAARRYIEVHVPNAGYDTGAPKGPTPDEILGTVCGGDWRKVVRLERRMMDLVKELGKRAGPKLARKPCRVCGGTDKPFRGTICDRCKQREYRARKKQEREAA